MPINVDPELHLPWVAEEDDEFIDLTDAQKEFTACRVSKPGRGLTEQDKRRAEFIAKACNSYHAMVAALEAVKQSGDQNKALVDEALAKANERPAGFYS